MPPFPDPAVDDFDAHEGRFREILEALLEGVNLIGFDRRIRYINPAAALQGRQEQFAVIGRTLRDIYPGFEGTELDQAIERCLDTREPWREVIEFTFEDGERRWFQVSVRPVPEGVVVLSVDVDELHRSRGALAHAGERLRGLLAGIPDLIFVLSDAGVILDYHARDERSLALPPAEFLGRSLEAVLPATTFRLFRQAMDEALRTGAPQTIDYALDVPLGRRWFEAVLVPFGEGRISAVARDVSERRELEEQLRQSQKMEAVGELASGIAHDFNNLLTVVGANVEHLQAEFGSSGVGARELAEMASVTRRGAELVQRLLRFSRRGILEPRALALGEELVELVPVLQRLLPASVSVACEPRDEGAAVWCDVTALHQIVINLCTNARDAMPTGGAITLSTDIVDLDAAGARAVGGIHPGRYVRVAVQDSGAGMDEALRNRIFEPFYTTKAPGVGTGLGLSMVYGLMKGHNGAVTVDSHPGVGTTFHLYFPAIDLVPEAPSSGATERPPLGLPGGTETILLVEDEPAIRRVAGATLRRLGYTVHEAANGQQGEALYLAHRDTIQLVLTDLVMPQVGGAEMLERLRQHGMHAPAIVMSGYAPGATDTDPHLPEAAAFLAKPWTLADLAAAVRHVLDR